MLKHNVLEKLDEEKSKRISSSSEVLDSAKLLLESNSGKEREVLRSLGLDTHIKVVEKENELQILNKEYSEKYEGKVFHIDELFKIGMRYRLYLKPSRKYRGQIPADLGPTLVRLMEKHNLNINVSVHSDSGRFFILAPPSEFSDYLTPRERYREMYGQTFKKIKNALTAPVDPIIFYKVDEEHFIMIKKWGDDFSFVRRALGYFTATNFWLRLSSIVFLIALVLGGICTDVNYGATHNSSVTSFAWTMAALIVSELFLLAAFAIPFLVYTAETNSGNEEGVYWFGTNVHWRKDFQRG